MESWYDPVLMPLGMAGLLWVLACIVSGWFLFDLRQPVVTWWLVHLTVYGMLAVGVCLRLFWKLYGHHLRRP